MSWIDIAHPGTFRDMNGREVTITTDFMKKIMAKSDPKTASWKARLVFGHPKTNHPSFGILDGLQIVNKRDKSGAYVDCLQAKFAGVKPAVNQAIADKHYTGVSMAVKDDGELIHIGLLGAVPPAIEGLEEVMALSGDVGTIIYTFAEEEKAIMTEAEIKALRDEIERLKKENEELKKQLEAEKAARAGAEAAKANAESTFATYKHEQSVIAREARFAQLVADERVLPTEKAAIMAKIEVLEASDKRMQFAASDGTVKELSLAENEWRLLASRPKNGLLTEMCSEAQAYVQPPAKTEKIDMKKM